MAHVKVFKGFSGGAVLYVLVFHFVSFFPSRVDVVYNKITGTYTCCPRLHFYMTWMRKWWKMKDCDLIEKKPPENEMTSRGRTVNTSESHSAGSRNELSACADVCHNEFIFYQDHHDCFINTEIKYAHSRCYCCYYLKSIPYWSTNE